MIIEYDDIMLVKKYIHKHYKVYRIRTFTDDISKGYRSFDIYNIEEDCETFTYVVYPLLSKIFGVDKMTIAKAFKEICNEQTLKLKSMQLKIDYEGNSV